MYNKFFKMEDKKAIATPPTKRDSSIELLRIISMIMIVIFHFAYHGKFEWEHSSLSLQRFWYNFIVLGGKIGVDVFVLISGYFLVNSNRSISTNTKKLLKLWGQIFFYSATIYIIFTLTGRNPSGIKPTIIPVFLPITYNTWWFASTYFVMFLLHPFINKFIGCLNTKSYQNLLFLLILCWYIIPSLTGEMYQGTPLLRFITLYLIAGYIKIYGLNPKLKCRHYFILFLTFSTLNYLASVTYTLLGVKKEVYADRAINLFAPHNLFVLLIALTLFMTFVTLKISYRKWINVMASATFGVYLIHDNGYTRPYLWIELFKNNHYQDTLILIPYSIAVTIIIYTVCTLIELIRQQVLDKPYMKFVNRYTDVWLGTIRSVNSRIKRIVFGE